MSEVSESASSPESFPFDALVFGRRLRHLRKEHGLTLKELAGRIGKHAPYLSQVETGKREPNLSTVNALAQALAVRPADLLSPAPPSRRAELEMALERAQRDPLWQQGLGLPRFTPPARVPTAMLEMVLRLFEELRYRGQLRAATPEGARRANAELREEMRARDNYFTEVERAAREILEAVGYLGAGPLSQRHVEEVARHLGFTVHPVRDVPSSVRSVADLRNHRIYVRQGNQVGSRAMRWVVIQTLGHLVLGHGDPKGFAEFLRQRVETNYFAGAVLIPEQSAVPFLIAAKQERDLSVGDLEERFAVSHEMAAHRFTNLATRHLDIRVHFVRSDQGGLIWKAYENDDIAFPADPDGGIEGQLLCRFWGPRQAFGSEHPLSVYYQYTDTPAGTYWDATHIEDGREALHGIAVGTRFQDARFFRGSDTSKRASSNCPQGLCCRRPPVDLARRWDGYAWPSPRAHSHILATLPSGTYPGVDTSELYEFLDRRTLDQ